MALSTTATGESKRYKIIANPAAGGGAGGRAIASIRQILDGNGLNYQLVTTQRPLHAAELTAKAVLEEGCEVVVAAGGDGTSNEVLNGLVACKQAAHHPFAMGVLGVRRGNDFADAVGIPRDLEEACRVLVNGKCQTIDIGRVSGSFSPHIRYFGNCVGIGFDAIGTIEAAKLPRLSGFLSYLIAVLKTIFLYYRAPLTRIEFDGQVLTQPALLVSIMNGRRLGGGFLMAPHARPDDGKFELCIAGEMSRRRMLAMLPHFLRGTQASQKEIKTASAVRITVTALQGSLPAQTDGEVLCVDGEHLEIQLLKDGIEIICP